MKPKIVCAKCKTYVEHIEEQPTGFVLRCHGQQQHLYADSLEDIHTFPTFKAFLYHPELSTEAMPTPPHQTSPRTV